MVIFFIEEGDELESGVRVADSDPSGDGARDDDDVDHGCCCLRHGVVALPNDCSGQELENSSQDEIVPDEFGNKPEVVFSSSVSTCPSLAAGLERDETVERNEESDDKQDACHDVEDTRVEGPGEVRMGIGNVTNPGSAAGGDPLAKWKSLIADRKKAGKELSFEKLSSAFGQAMQQLVKEIEMELAGESATEDQTCSDEMYAPSWTQQLSRGGTAP